MSLKTASCLSNFPPKTPTGARSQNRQIKSLVIIPEWVSPEQQKIQWHHHFNSKIFTMCIHAFSGGNGSPRKIKQLSLPSDDESGIQECPVGSKSQSLITIYTPSYQTWQNSKRFN